MTITTTEQQHPSEVAEPGSTGQRRKERPSRGVTRTQP